MSQQNELKRGGEIPDNERTAKLAIKKMKNTNISLFAKMLDASPDFVEHTPMPVLRFEMRKTDSEPLGYDTAEGPLKAKIKELYAVREKP